MKDVYIFFLTRLGRSDGRGVISWCKFYGMRNTKTSELIPTIISCAAGGAMLGSHFGSTGSTVGAVVAAIFGAFSDRLAEAEEKWRSSRHTPKS